MPVPIISIVSKKNCGKTTLLEKLIPELKQRGYRVGTIKHDVHGFNIDHEGKDTFRHKSAGADIVAISCPWKISIIMDVAEETISTVFSDVLKKKIEVPFPRMQYSEAIERYGLDKPDVRFGLELKDISDIVEK